MSSKAAAVRKFTYKKLIRYFIQGLLILAPITLTGYALYWLFENVDGILRPYVSIPGVGFVIIIVFVILIGWLSSNLITGSLFSLFDHWLERTPGIKLIYSTLKDFFEAFAGDKRKFNKPILVNVFAEEVWLVGFLTSEDLEKFELGAEYVSAYVPQGYNIAGQVYLVKKERVRRLEDVAASDAMKFAVTGGVVEFDEEKPKETDHKNK